MYFFKAINERLKVALSFYERIGLGNKNMR